MRATNTVDNLRGIDRDEAVSTGGIYFTVGPPPDKTSRVRIISSPTSLEEPSVFNTQQENE